MYVVFYSRFRLKHLFLFSFQMCGVQFLNRNETKRFRNNVCAQFVYAVKLEKKFLFFFCSFRIRITECREIFYSRFHWKWFSNLFSVKIYNLVNYINWIVRWFEAIKGHAVDIDLSKLIHQFRNKNVGFFFFVFVSLLPHRNPLNWWFFFFIFFHSLQICYILFSFCWFLFVAFIFILSLMCRCRRRRCFSLSLFFVSISFYLFVVVFFFVGYCGSLTLTMRLDGRLCWS